MTNPITPADITAACNFLGRYLSHFPLPRPLPTTPGRRHAAILAHGRDTLAARLMSTHGIKTISALTKAIRAGHAGTATDFDAINTRAAQALDLLEY